MVAPVHPQEVRLAKRLDAGAYILIRADGTWMIRDGQETWLSDKWINRMKAHGLIRYYCPAVLAYGEWILTPEGTALARS